MPTPELTVVVPTHNGAAHLRATLDSLAAQTHRPVVLVVDDGSADASAEIAEGHPAVDRVLRQPNRGVAVARNRGLALATSSHVAFLDQDDLWHASRTTELLALADEHGAPAVGTTDGRFALSGDRGALSELGDERLNWDITWIEPGEEAALLARSPAGTGAVARFGGSPT